VWHELIKEMQQQQAFIDLLARGWATEYAAAGGRIHCARGCRGCCSLAVNCTFTEAVAIAGALTGEQAERVRDHVARLRAGIDGVTELKEYLLRHRRLVGFCPFLAEDGACGIYSLRPLACRALLSTKESRWCSADFSGLSAGEKGAFLASLDRSVVAFPMHYVAAMQEAGEELEAAASRRMAERCGFSLYGSMPVLVHLAEDHGLAAACPAGYDAVARLLEATSLNHPLLLHVGR